MTDEPNDALQQAIAKRRKEEAAQAYGTTAVVKLTLEVECKSHWSGNATAMEVMEIGGKETMFAIENALQAAGLSFKVRDHHIGLITFHRKT